MQEPMVSGLTFSDSSQIFLMYTLVSKGSVMYRLAIRANTLPYVLTLPAWRPTNSSKSVPETTGEARLQATHIMSAMPVTMQLNIQPQHRSTNPLL